MGSPMKSWKMKTVHALAIPSFAILAAMPAATQELNKLTPAETAAGFKLLWDGTAAGKSASLMSGTSGTTNTWSVVDNALKDPNSDDAASPGPDAFLFTKEKYADFEFIVEWKVNAGGNSGIFPRQNARTGYCDTYEFAILDDYIGSGDAQDKLKNPGESTAWAKRSATIYDMYPTTENGILMKDGGKQVAFTKPADQWNRGVIFMNGNFGEHWLNGKKVVDFEIGSAEWLGRFALSKFPAGGFNCQAATYGRAASGYIGFQDHGGNLRISLRNMKIRPFTPGSKLPAPMASPNGGSFVSATKVSLDAGITGAVIRYTLNGTDPTESSPMYNDSTGLLLSTTTVVKAKSFRARFGGSDVSTSTFTISGSTLQGAGPIAVPEVGFIRVAGKLHLSNRSGHPLSIDLVSTQGEVMRRLQVRAGAVSVAVDGIAGGVYLARIRAGTRLDSRLLAVP